jgi:hypothetical protein
VALSLAGIILPDHHYNATTISFYGGIGNIRGLAFQHPEHLSHHFFGQDQYTGDSQRGYTTKGKHRSERDGASLFVPSRPIGMFDCKT